MSKNNNPSNNRLFTTFLNDEKAKKSAKKSTVAEKFINPKKEVINTPQSDEQSQDTKSYDVEYDAAGRVVLNYHDCIMKAPYRMSQIIGDRMDYMLALQGKTPADD